MESNPVAKYQTTVLIIMITLAVTFLGFYDKLNAENVLFTLAGAVAGLAVPRRED